MFSNNRNWLEHLTNICVTVTCAIACVALVRSLRTTERAFVPPHPPEYALGDALPALDSVDYARHRRTMLVFVSTTCRFCDESVPFYKTLSSLPGRGDLQFVLVGGEGQAQLAQWAAQHQLRIDVIVTIRPGTLKVSGTPTLILASETGHVVGQWMGALRGREREVEAALN